MDTEIINWTALSPGAVLQRRDNWGVVYFDGLVETNDLMFRCTNSTSGESYTLFKRDFVLADPYVELNTAQKTLHRRRYPEVYGEASSKGESAFNTQEGGEHYSSLPEGYQPFQISKALGLNPVEHTILKYLLRHASKDGKAALLKAKHCIDILIEQEYPDATD